MTNASCPVADKGGKPVPLITLRSLVLPEHAAVVEGREWFFCDRPACDIVYFTRDGRTLDKNSLKIRVGLKEKEAPRPVCYCFGHTVESICEEIGRTGRSTVAASIKEKVEAGECSCEVLNPRGTCCLGDVNKTVKEVFASIAISRRAGHQPLAAVERPNEGCCRPTSRGARGEWEGSRRPEPALARQGVDSGQEE